MYEVQHRLTTGNIDAWETQRQGDSAAVQHRRHQSLRDNSKLRGMPQKEKIFSQGNGKLE